MLNEIKDKKKFHWRSFTTFYIIISFLIMSISGIILYFSPPGRVAYWAEWRFIALTKTNWQAIHTIFTFLFIAAASFHIYFNWKVITSYLKIKMQEGMKKKRELALSSSLGAIILVLTIINVPPFSTVMNWGDDLSNSWATKETEPPIPHAELLTVYEFGELIKLPVAEIQNRLKKNGVITNDSTLTIKEIAAKNEITPQKLYEFLNVKKTSSNKITLTEGSGYGRKTIGEISELLSVPLQKAINNLKKKGIDATSEDNIRDLASSNNMLPIEVVRIIQTD